MRWIPLESNPDVMNKFLRELGLKEPMRFVELYGTNPDMQALIPAPALAVMLLYPLTENAKNNPIGIVSMDEKCFFMKQTISNSCGTVAIIHALANNTDAFHVESLPWLHKFLEKTEDVAPLERGQILEKEEELGELHENCAQEGQTEVPGPESKVDLHFVAFVNSNGHLIELDGRRDGPIFHGKTSSGTFLTDACKVVDQFMQRDPENINFCLMALTNTPE